MAPAEPTTGLTTKSPALSERPTQQAMPAPPETRASGPAPRGEPGDPERDERIRTALVWSRFETWCASHGLRAPPASGEAVALVAVYITFLAASGRNVAVIARALLRAREEE
jgi:hypothetical protein